MVSRLEGEKSEGGCGASFLAGETSGLTNPIPEPHLTAAFPLCYKHKRNPAEEAFFSMQLAKNIGFYLGFVAASALFLVVEHFTHIEFFLHVAAIPLEVLVAVFIVEKMLESRETKEKRRQLMFIFEDIFLDMIYILHFINDVKAFKERYPDRMHLARS